MSMELKFWVVLPVKFVPHPKAFEEKEFINLLKKYFTFSHIRKIKVNFENFQNNLIVGNSCLIVWGRLK